MVFGYVAGCYQVLALFSIPTITNTDTSCVWLHLRLLSIPSPVQDFVIVKASLSTNDGDSVDDERDYYHNHHHHAPVTKTMSAPMRFF